jgi:hypothetical protein
MPRQLEGVWHEAQRFSRGLIMNSGE